MSALILRFLADECCDLAVVRALRAFGYDVLAMSEVRQRSVDSEIIAQAAREQRIVLTEDKDFGWLLFVRHAKRSAAIRRHHPELWQASNRLLPE